ncbi:hypothetical protein HK101_005245 [Irineochytrium annulatum]|nr:hypothetical protein HK101_005245 [Irineochytrium annulatum]
MNQRPPGLASRGMKMPPSGQGAQPQQYNLNQSQQQYNANKRPSGYSTPGNAPQPRPAPPHAQRTLTPRSQYQQQGPDTMYGGGHGHGSGGSNAPTMRAGGSSGGQMMYQEDQQGGFGAQGHSHTGSISQGAYVTPHPQAPQRLYGNNVPANVTRASDGFGQSVGVGGQQQQQQQQPSFANQFANFQNNAASQLGMQFGAQALQQGEQIVKQNINRYVNVSNLKRYFNVSNSYVLNKIKVLLFPFRHQTWTRLVIRANDGQMEGFKPPREDLNAPDLYIPSMAFVTYVLIVGAMYGAAKNFTPDALGLTSTTALVVSVCEILFVKLGCYLLSISSDAPFMDLVAYCGYKFVPLVHVVR